MIWLKENIANIVVFILTAALICLCVRSLIKQKRSGLPACACGKNCATCALRYVHGMAERKI